jgi:hypothetical protein
MKTLLSIFIFLSIYQSFGCSFDTIQKELAKIHGPNWEYLKKSQNCTNQQLFKELKSVIKNHEKKIGTYDLTTTRGLLYRNAVRSIGHFAQINQEGVVSEKQMEFFENFYQAPNQYLNGLYKTKFTPYENTVNLFKSQIIDSIKSTGSVSAIDFFHDIIENEEMPFLVQDAGKAIVEILYGREEYHAEGQGDRQHEAPYTPYLDQEIAQRFKNLDQDMLKDKISAVNDSIEIYLKKSGNQYPVLVADLKKVRKQMNQFVTGTTPKKEKKRGISSEDFVLTRNQIQNHAHDRDHHHGHKQTTKEQERDPAAFEDNSNAFNLWDYKVVFIILAVLLFFVRFFFKKDS